MKKLATEIQETKNVPKVSWTSRWRGFFGLYDDYRFFFRAAFEHIITRPLMEIIIISSFIYTTFGFLIVGIYAISDVYWSMKGEYEQLKKEKEEVKKDSEELEKAILEEFKRGRMYAEPTRLPQEK